jgi:hypothetical protein
MKLGSIWGFARVPEQHLLQLLVVQNMLDQGPDCARLTLLSLNDGAALISLLMLAPRPLTAMPRDVISRRPWQD